MGRRLVILAALIALGSREAAAQTADEIAERFIVATGGRAAYAKLRSRYASGTIVLSTPAGDVSGTIETWNEAPNKVRTLIKADLTALGAGPLVIDQRFDGVYGYVLDNLQGNRDLEGNQLETMRSGSFPNPLLDYKQLGATLQLTGKDKVGARDAYAVVFEPTSGSPTRFLIDTETYLALEVAVKLDVPQVGREIEQTTTLLDYRDVDGVKLPHRLNVTSSIQNFTITFTHVEHNVRIDPAFFVKPPAK